MKTARTELPCPCSPQAKTRDESSRRGASLNVERSVARPLVTFGGSGGIMTTASTELPCPCSPQAKTRDESSRRGK